MKVSEIVKLIKKGGCYIKRHGAEHDMWYSPITGKSFMIPRHQSKELPKGTENKIKKDAGI